MSQYRENLPDPSRPGEVLDRVTEVVEELVKKGQFREALGQFEAVLAMLQEPDARSDVLLGAAYCLAQLGRTKEAHERLQQAAELLPAGSPECSHLDYTEAIILDAENKRKEALQLLNRLVGDKERVLKATRGEELYQDIESQQRFLSAQELLGKRQFEKALRQYEFLSGIVKEPHNRFGNLIGAADCLVQLGRIEEARHRLREAAELLSAGSPDRAHIDFTQAGILAAEGSRKEALQVLADLVRDKDRLSEAVRGSELYKEIQLRRACLLIELENYKEARPILEEVLTFGIEHVSVPFYAGICYFGLGEYELAKKYYQQALKMDLGPVWEWQARVHLGPIYYRGGALAKAKLEFERAETLGGEIGPLPKDRKNVYLWLAKICRELDQGDEAVHYEELARKR